MTPESLVIMIGGEAGQGLATIGDVLVKSLVASGYHIVVTQDYQSRIRGGHNTFVIRAAAEKIEAPREAVDLLLAFNEETVRLHQGRMAPDGLIVAGESLEIEPAGALRVPFKDLAPGRFANITALGVAGKILGLPQKTMAGILEKMFGKKHPEAVAQNSEALSKAFDWCEGRQTPPGLTLPEVATPPGRMAINGNEAIALGALAAGVKFAAFYPMTPSTSIALNLVSRAEKMGLVVEQAEDEIAAINMAVGASYTGAPSMVTTSGGGYALMGEGVSLAAIIEVPVVVAVVQRPGPATGLPTRTEQGDLEFVLHSGHGEFARAVFAPGTIEQCFDLTRKAFELAEKYQTPAFILSDQFLADSHRAVSPFALDGLKAVNPAAAQPDPIDGPYERYALTPDGVSPRLLPGLSEHLVRSDSDEHTPDGFLTEDLDVRIKMMDKRLAKMKGLSAEILAPEWIGDDRPDILLVCWGSSRGAVVEASAELKSKGRQSAVLHFSQIWPLDPNQFLPRLEKAVRVVAVEGNATAQMARLIRRETGYHIEERILRYDGLPFTPEYILRRLAN